MIDAAPQLRVVARAFGRAGGAVGFWTLATAFALKLAYSHAGSDQLAFVLAPSCWLASELGGLHLTPETGAGFIMHRPRMVVGPACAGVNFLVVSWLALFFTLQARFEGARRKLAVWAVSLLAAYLATLATNSLRIVLAAHLYDLPIYAGWLTKARLHRVLGVVLYCTTLLGVCRIADRCSSRAPLPASASLLAPFGWYLAVALGLPLANRAFVRDPGHFLEHAALTLGVGALVVLLFRVIGRLVDRVCSRGATS